MQPTFQYENSQLGTEGKHFNTLKAILINP